MYYLIGLIMCISADTNGPWSLLGNTGYSGEIIVNGQTGSSMFFWQFNAENGNISTDRRPLVIWSQGGPGCASEIGMLGERISPIYVDDNTIPHFCNSTWTLFYHLLAIDFPLDSGFSYASQPEDVKNTTADAIDQLYSFLQILGGKYPTWFQRDVYWFGEDYAGHFIPAIATKILSSNQNANTTGAIVIPLKGIGLGDPWADATYQTQYYNTVMYNLGLANSQQAAALAQLQGSISTSIQNGDYVSAYQNFSSVLSQIASNTNNVNIYNMRNYAAQDLGDVHGWLNTPSVKKSLNVPAAAIWNACNPVVQTDFSTDSMQGFATGMMPGLLSTLKVLIYHGQDDLYVNTLGINTWLSAIQWCLMPSFLASRRSVWNVAGQVAGYVQTYSNLTYVQVINAGNQAALNQPFAVRDMVNRFILNQGWN